LEKLKNVGTKISGSNFEDKTPNAVQKQVLVENDDVHCIKLDPYELEYVYVEDDAVQDGESFMAPEHDPLSTSSPIIPNIHMDVRANEYSRIIAEQNDNGRELGATGKFAETFSKLYHKVCKLRRDSDNENMTQRTLKTLAMNSRLERNYDRKSQKLEKMLQLQLLVAGTP
ncbi:Anthranilate phosphoribosyltransferase, partial [Orchesella cincta]